MLRASGVASTHIGHPSVIPHRARRCRPTQLSSQQKCILCDRHHTASAMAELACYLSIVPHMRSFDVPPKHSAPLTRGLFCAARLSASRTKKAPPASGAQVGTPWMWTLAFGHHEDRTDTRLCRDARRRERPRRSCAAEQSDETAPREIEHGEQSSAKWHRVNRLSHRNQAPPLASRGDFDAIRNEREHRPCAME